MNQEIIVRRLALIKHLYQMGVDQSKRFDPASAFSLLMLHDSIEMFLKLLAEKNNIDSNNISFMEFWTKFPTLTLKESLRNLNSRRVNVKHKGLLPSKSDIEISRINTTDFFEQNTLSQFGVEFKDISLTSLVSFENTNRSLQDAQNELNKGNYKESIGNSALAFAYLLEEYEASKTTVLEGSLFKVKGNNSFARATSINSAVKDNNRDLKKLLEYLKDQIEGLQTELKIVGLGIDYKKYIRFKALAPEIIWVLGQGQGSLMPLVGGERRFRKFNLENAQYCIDFVIDCSLSLQEFDFELSEIIEGDWGKPAR